MRPFFAYSAIGLVCVVIAWASACTKADPSGASPTGSAVRPVESAPRLSHAPPPKSTRRTTSGEIAIANLNGQISSLERLAGQSNTDPRRRQFIELLSLRGDMTGRIADIVRAAEMAENLPKDMHDKPEGYLTRASMRAALHRFDDAWSDLDEAERRGATAVQTRNKRVSILAARGRVDEALALASKAREEQPNIDTIGIMAVLLGEAGRKDEAIVAFREAFEAMADTSPFPIAWLFFAQAQFWEREGNTELAMAYYKAVLERLPVHAHAAAHAARLATPLEAESILKPMLATSDDPDVHTVLAVKLRARGELVEAKVHVDAAAARYEALVAQHPEAFADHAAQFWLDAGNDPQKALELAKRNLQVRKTLKAYELTVVAALASQNRKLACEMGTEGLEKARPTSMFREIVRGTCAAK